MKTLELRRFADRTLPALLRATVRRRPDAPFLLVLDPAAPQAEPRPVTFAAFDRGVRGAAASLRGLGLGPGDRMLFLAENSPEWQELALGAQALRAEPAAIFASL